VRQIISIVISLSFFSISIGQKTNNTDSLISFDDLTSSIILIRKGYVLSYDTSMLKTNCVYYLHTKAKRVKKIDRSNDFITDSLFVNIDFNNDYKYSGFDRGHLAPAGDMAYDSIAMRESFYYSNVSPQAPSFNRGIWKKLEEQTRNWVDKYDSIYVFAGSVFFDDSLKFIGRDSIPVPDSFFKIVMNKRKGGYFILAFEIPNRPTKLPLQTFTTTIDEIERKTKINFFPFVSDELENSIHLDQWEFK
jgi:endonuclease G, mitochondrial